MNWQMFQVWYSESGRLRPGPRFRLLRDALRFGLKQVETRSFAIRTPEGTWHRDQSTSRSIFGPGCTSPVVIVEPPKKPAISLANIDDEDTQPFGSGSRQHRVRTSSSAESFEDVDEPTDVIWPPKHLKPTN